ncbi:formylglycine-generating enzyme family protein [Leifsonia xyli]|uniref:formylglycine-generating enzyme family protein n=1 Tax=Leifsonia xyli TaxID=1575 RepID=UPI003D66B395
MVRIEGGTFSMGSAEFYPDEQPVHRRSVQTFLIDRYEVTNAEFASFVDATGYVTVAERPLEAQLFPELSDDERMPGSMVFTMTPGPVDLGEWRNWWRWEPGADWRHPEGAGSSIEHRMDRPVVQVAYEDAVAYAAWSGKRLPTEAEHEFAARGGVEGARFAWGEEPYPGGEARANSWIGRFPYDNRGRFGAAPAPVGSYPANGYGLFDMIGNVWEWTSDVYAPRHVVPGEAAVEAGSRPNLLAAGASDPAASPRRVLKGGSYLCSPEYCLRFRPAARSPQSDDTSTTHIGFRCAKDATA